MLKKNPVFKFFSSLKLAVISILTLAAVLTYGTIVESFYGMRGAHHLVYGTWWFMGVLVMLGLNVLCAALSRYPWKRHQTGFVITHLGILTLLFGSFLTQRFGLDGNLPVVEGGKNNDVILNDLVLFIQDSEESTPIEVPVPESARARSGDLLNVNLGGADNLRVTRFAPRVVEERQTVASPLAGAGVPAIELALFNSRFRVEEWMMAALPDQPTELNLGPAILTFQKLWSPAAEKEFFHPKPTAQTKAAKIGKLILEVGGKEYYAVIDDYLKKWKPLPGTGLQLIVDRYLPYAVVEKNDLVSKSNEPKNPAAQLRLKNAAGDEEKHTVFALFPEFSTLHGAHGGGDKHLGVKVRMLAAADEAELMGVGKKRGRLEFAQTADDLKILYRALDPNGKVNSQGEVKLGTPQDTGWMDLRFEMKTWLPSAIQQQVPREVDEISGGDANFLAAVQIEPGGWLIEGESKALQIGAKRISVRLGKSHQTLPFPIYLKKFTVGNDPGTTKAATYESEVMVKDGTQGVEKNALISMNEPLVHGGYTFYQASYQLREGQPPISVFAVNWDPGRWVKYLGSLFMVIGAALMFYMNPHYWDILFGRKRRAT